MYISTPHHVGDTVYYYRTDEDSVDRAKIERITYVKTATTEEVFYSISIRHSQGLVQVLGDSLYTRPESAFYGNPLPPEAVAE